MPPPPTPLPESIPTFTVPLPILLPGEGMRPDLEELSWFFTKVEERAYTATDPAEGTEYMYAATYQADTTWFGLKKWAIVINSETGVIDHPEVVEKMVKDVALAFARNECFNIAYDYHPAPAPPKPDNPGYGSPLYQAAIDTPNGTMKLRGFCSGLRWLDPDDVATVDVYVEKVFYEPSAPA